MIPIELKLTDEIDQFSNMLGALGRDASKILVRSLNRAGDTGRTGLVRVVSKGTLMPQKTIRKALKVSRARSNNLEYVIVARGGDISLKYFRPVEVRSGARVRLPDGQMVVDGAFVRGGIFPRRRVDLNMGGHVFARTGADRLGIEKQTSGVSIPGELIDGAGADEFDRIARKTLPDRLNHEISRALGI